MSTEQAAGRLPCHEELCLHAGRLHLNAVYQSGGKTEEVGKLFQDQLVLKKLFLRVSDKTRNV